MSEVLGSKLSDRIRTEGMTVYSHGLPITGGMKLEAARLQHLVNTSPVFFIQNVADYYAKFIEPNREFEVDSLPCLAPPYPAFFTEFRFNKGSEARGRGITRGGILFEASEEQETFQRVLPPEIAKQTRWTLMGTTIMEHEGHIPFATSHHAVALGENGAVVPGSSARGTMVMEDIHGTAIMDDADRSRTLATYYSGVFFPSLLAITFTHCKGTDIREESSPEKLSRQFERRTGLPLLRYHVIDVNPFQQVLSKEGNVERVGLPQALTTVRGHFADYRENGLFGKIHRIIWKPDGERGDPANGIIRKDYNSNIPL